MTVIPNTIVCIDSVIIDEDAGVARFTVTLSGTNPRPFSVNVETSDGTASAGEDCVARSIVQAFAGSNEETHFFDVTLEDDAIPEPDEIFTVTLSNTTNTMALGQASGTATIRENDGFITVIFLDGFEVEEP